MTLTIGRIGLDGSLGEPSSLTYVGDQVTLAGTAKGLSSSQWQALRDQFRGLINPDGVVVPITSVNDSSINGFYSVDSVSPPPMDPNGQYGGWFNWQVQATRIPDSQMPGVELDLWGGFLTGNGIGAAKTDAIPWAALPVSAVDVALDPSIWSTLASGGFSGVVSGADRRDVQLFQSSVDGFQHDRIAWAAQPGSWYDGACVFEWSYDGGSTWTPMTGRQLPPFAPLAPAWRITNQFMQVTQPAAATAAQLNFQHWVPSGAPHWSTAKTVDLLHSNPATGNIFGISSITITRYTEAIITVRLGLTYGIASLGFPIHYYSVDLVLRRGSPFLEIGFQQVVPNLSGTVGLVVDPAQSSTAISALPGSTHSGIITNSDAFIIASSDAVTNDTTNGGISKSITGGATPQHVQMLAGYQIDSSVPTAQLLQMILGTFHAETRFVGRL